MVPFRTYPRGEPLDSLIFKMKFNLLASETHTLCFFTSIRVCFKKIFSSSTWAETIIILEFSIDSGNSESYNFHIVSVLVFCLIKYFVSFERLHFCFIHILISNSSNLSILYCEYFRWRKLIEYNLRVKFRFNYLSL